MKLVIKDNEIYAVAENISYGIYENEEKWRLADADDNIMYYMIDDGFALVEDVTLPDDYEDGKYFYENGEFVLNEDWNPYVTPEERITQLEAQVAIHEENDAELLYQVCLLQLGLSEEDL